MASLWGGDITWQAEFNGELFRKLTVDLGKKHSWKHMASKISFYYLWHCSKWAFVVPQWYLTFLPLVSYNTASFYTLV